MIESIDGGEADVLLPPLGLEEHHEPRLPRVERELARHCGGQRREEHCADE
eukprot:CAMPEP_0174942132 /NCGR_PEP_ID=MMETSP1355-20121228/73473_1 /TAXON_ID=464990 /ORGANISM="Hemiselmis tepida, Strain CCMP443" /LENGTH=50 /DNA_ID=CAMNT_0016189287 /DNA_START=25 /DNA_END=175 /DNA_ORIENTATION=-